MGLEGDFGHSDHIARLQLEVTFLDLPGQQIGDPGLERLPATVDQAHDDRKRVRDDRSEIDFF